MFQTLVQHFHYIIKQKTMKTTLKRKSKRLSKQNFSNTIIKHETAKLAARQQRQQQKESHYDACVGIYLLSRLR